MRRSIRFLTHFISNLKRAWIMSDINADLDTCAAIVAGLPAKIQAKEAADLAAGEAAIAPKVSDLLTNLQAVDASVTQAAEG
jgi:hypothetical protein